VSPLNLLGLWGLWDHLAVCLCPPKFFHFLWGMCYIKGKQVISYSWNFSFHDIIWCRYHDFTQCKIHFSVVNQVQEDVQKTSVEEWTPMKVPCEKNDNNGERFCHKMAHSNRNINGWRWQHWLWLLNQDSVEAIMRWHTNLLSGIDVEVWIRKQ
jgi:hypothetical protein